jgi:hypothetical protein
LYGLHNWLKVSAVSDCFEDVWLAEVEAEYLALLRHSRAVGVDTGNQFRAFEQFVANGLDRTFRPLDRLATADVYVMYGSAALMFFAVETGDTVRRDVRRRIAVVKWTVLGTEHEQRQARTDARERASRVFP